MKTVYPYVNGQSQTESKAKEMKQQTMAFLKIHNHCILLHGRKLNMSSNDSNACLVFDKFLLQTIVVVTHTYFGNNINCSSMDHGDIKTNNSNLNLQA